MLQHQINNPDLINILRIVFIILNKNNNFFNKKFKLLESYILKCRNNVKHFFSLLLIIKLNKIYLNIRETKEW